jgi:hypothetical protein
MAPHYDDTPRTIPTASGLADTVDGLAPTPHSAISVLVVDVDRSLREACVSFFKVGGYDVTPLGSVAEAV